MRLAHHLLRHPSGVFHFRLVVPADLRQVFGKKIVKISLRTKDPTAAKAYAYALGARYAQDFAEARGKGEVGQRGIDLLQVVELTTLYGVPFVEFARRLQERLSSRETQRRPPRRRRSNP